MCLKKQCNVLTRCSFARDEATIYRTIYHSYGKINMKTDFCAPRQPRVPRSHNKQSFFSREKKEEFNSGLDNW